MLELDSCVYCLVAITLGINDLLCSFPSVAALWTGEQILVKYSVPNMGITTIEAGEATASSGPAVVMKGRILNFFCLSLGLNHPILKWIVTHAHSDYCHDTHAIWYRYRWISMIAMMWCGIFSMPWCRLCLIHNHNQGSDLNFNQGYLPGFSQFFFFLKIFLSFSARRIAT